MLKTRYCFTGALGLVLSFSSCKSTEPLNGSSTTKDVTSDVPFVPPQVVLAKNILLNIGGLSDFGYQPSHNCFMTYRIATRQGGTEHYLDGYSLPCQSGIYSEHPTAEILNSRILHLKLNDIVIRFSSFLSVPGLVYSQGFLIPNSTSPDQQIILKATEKWSDSSPRSPGKQVPRERSTASLATHATEIYFNLDRIDVHINAQGTIDKIAPKAQ